MLELRDSGALAECQRLAPKVLITNDVEPEATVTVGDPPKPLSQQGDVHALGRHDPQTTLVAGLADVGLAHRVVFLLIALSSPVKTRLVLGNLVMQGLMETIDAHHENEKARHGVDEHGFGRLGQPPALPRFNPVLEPRHRRPQVSDGEARVINGYPQVGGGEVPKLAVKAVGDELGLVGLVAKDHHFTFVKVDLEPRHLLEAEEEFEVDNIILRSLHHDNGVINILQERNPSPSYGMSNNTMNMVDRLGLV